MLGTNASPGLLNLKADPSASPKDSVRSAAEETPVPQGTMTLKLRVPYRVGPIVEQLQHSVDLDVTRRSPLFRVGSGILRRPQDEDGRDWTGWTGWDRRDGMRRDRMDGTGRDGTGKVDFAGFRAGGSSDFFFLPRK